MKRNYPVTSTSGSNGNGNGSPNKKRPGPWLNPPSSSSSASSSAAPASAPLKFMSWNVNSLMRRLIKDGGADWRGFRALVMQERPDLIALQEVKLPAAKGSDDRRRVCMDMSTPERWREYTQLYSAITGLGYEFVLSLADTGYAGTLVMVRRELQPAVRTCRFNFPGVEPAYKKEGRVILLGFDELDVLATYVPAHSEKPEFIERRRLWDDRLLAFLQARTKPYVWLGDLNSAENKMTYMKHKRLVDAYRALHPVGAQPSDADWTWRGNPVPHGKFYGQGSRYDYTLVSWSLFAPPHNLQIARAEVLGRGVKREGFFGSDHCPILLELVRAKPEQAPAAAAAAAPAP